MEISLTDLEVYIAGEKALPNPVFLAALDIVAHCSGPTRKPER